MAGTARQQHFTDRRGGCARGRYQRAPTRSVNNARDATADLCLSPSVTSRHPATPARCVLRSACLPPVPIIPSLLQSLGGFGVLRQTYVRRRLCSGLRWRLVLRVPSLTFKGRYYQSALARVL